MYWLLHVGPGTVSCDSFLLYFMHFFNYHFCFMALQTIRTIRTQILIYIKRKIFDINVFRLCSLCDGFIFENEYVDVSCLDTLSVRLHINVFTYYFTFLYKIHMQDSTEKILLLENHHKQNLLDIFYFIFKNPLKTFDRLL